LVVSGRRQRGGDGGGADVGFCNTDQGARETSMKNDRAKGKTVAKIPPPPGPEASYDELIAYHSKYSLDELEQAGYAEDASPEHVKEVAARAEYHFLCKHGLHVQLARKDYQQLSRLAAQEDVPAADLVKKWIKERLRDESKRNAKR